MNERHERRLEEVLDRLTLAVQHLREGENEQARMQLEMIRELRAMVLEQSIMIRELREIVAELRPKGPLQYAVSSIIVSVK